MKVSIPLNFYSISRVVQPSDYDRMGLKQIKRAASRGIVPRRVADTRVHHAKIAQSSIQRLVKWQQEYSDLYEMWLNSFDDHPKARALRAKLNRFEEMIDNHIETYHIDVGALSDGYHYNPNARIRLRGGVKRDRLVEDTPRESRVMEYRLKRKRAQVRALYQRIEDLKQENSITLDETQVEANNAIIGHLKYQAGQIGRTLHQF